MSMPSKKESQHTTNARLAILINSGAIDKSELNTLKLALRKLRSTNDIRRLPPRMMRLIQDFYRSTTDALLHSQVATAATGKQLRLNGEDKVIEIHKDVIQESVGDPPQVLVLRRKGIRIFPDGKRVALYTNDKVNISVTIPYTSKQFSPAMGVSTVGESQNLLEAKKASAPSKKKAAMKKKHATMDDIHDIVSSKKHKILHFQDGSSMPMDMFTAKAVRDLHLSLQDSKNRKYMETAIKNRTEFMKVINFAIGKRKK
jgi:hypothetical protein